MADGLAIAEQSLTGLMQRLNTLSQNIANANTPSYKAERSFLQTLNSLEPSKSEPLLSTSLNFEIGSIQQTGRDTDLALYSNGFFLVESGSEVFLTRNGQFQLNGAGELVNSQNMRVLGQGGSIRIGDSLTVHTDGSIWEEGQQLDSFRIVDAKSSSLSAIGGGLYRVDEGLSLQDIDKPVLLQGAIETSNVDSQQEMIELVKIMRQIEMQQRFIKAHDQMVESGINTIGEF